MSQHEVLRILEELGGSASLSEIRERARTKYARGSLHKYLHVVLRQLEKSGQVKKVLRGDTWLWTVSTQNVKVRPMP